MSALMEFLLRNADNKRVMATLRCGLVESTEMRAWPLLAHLDGIGSSQRARAVRSGFVRPSSPGLLFRQYGDRVSSALRQR